MIRIIWYECFMFYLFVFLDAEALSNGLESRIVSEANSFVSIPIEFWSFIAKNCEGNSSKSRVSFTKNDQMRIAQNVGLILDLPKVDTLGKSYWENLLESASQKYFCAPSRRKLWLVKMDKMENSEVK